MISDSTLLLIIAFALGFISSRCMSHQNILTEDIEEGFSDRRTSVLAKTIIIIILGLLGVGAIIKYIARKNQARKDGAELDATMTAHRARLAAAEAAKPTGELGANLMASPFVPQNK